MAIAWSEVIKSQEYQALTPPEQQAAKDQYWREVVVPNKDYQGLGPDEKLAAEKEFYGRTPFKTSGVERFAMGMTDVLTGGAAMAFDRFLASKYQQGAIQQDLPFIAGRTAGLLPVSMAATRAVGAIPGLGTSTNLLPTMARGALEGGAVGAYGFPEDRLYGAVTGAALGGVLAPSTLPFRNVSRVKGALASEEARLGRKGLNITPGRRLFSERASDALKQEQVRVGQASQAIKGQLGAIDDEIRAASTNSVKSLRDKLPKFFRDNSKAYGTRLDEISNVLVKEGRQMTRGQMQKVVDDTIAEIKSIGVKESDTLNRLTELSGKFSKQRGQFMKFKDFVEEIKVIKKGYSASIKGGKKFTQNDIGVSILNKNVGEVIPELAELNASYRPVIQAMKEASRRFKPFNGNFNDRAGINFLEKVARQGRKGLTDGEKALLKAIEDGNKDFAPGIGRITKTLDELGIKRANLDKTLQGNKDQLKALTDKLKTQLGDIKNLEADLKHFKNIRKAAIGAAGLAVYGATRQQQGTGSFPFISPNYAFPP